MAYNNGPRIVTDGLVLCLDAANRDSYPGTGTSWIDLTGQSTIASLDSTNMDASNWSSDHGGIFSFDGSNEYVDFSTPISSASTITVEMIVKIKETANGMFFGFSFYDFAQAYGHTVGYNTGASDFYGYYEPGLTSYYNKWKHFTFEMRSDVAATNNKLYINTVQQTLSQRAGTTGTRGFNNGNGRISSWRVDLNQVLMMDLAVFKIYNRPLSQSEIKQNYNATRGRFGI